MCAQCLANADDATLERLEKALVGLVWETRLAKGEGLSDGEGLDLWLDEEDAEVMGTVWGVYAHTVEQARLIEARRGEPLSEDERRALGEAARRQIEEGLARLSDGARERLAGILSELNSNLAAMIGGAINPLQAAARMQEALLEIAAAGGEGVAPQYSPYEWARLCRTEAAFAQNGARMAEYESQGGDPSAIEAVGAKPPIHPQCMCDVEMLEHEGHFWIVLSPNPTACAVCLDLAHAVMDYVEGGGLNPEEMIEKLMEGAEGDWQGGKPPEVQQVGDWSEWKDLAGRDPSGRIPRAFYDPDTHRLYVPDMKTYLRHCGDLQDWKERIAHEMQHAQEWQRGIPTTESTRSWREGLTEWATRDRLGLEETGYYDREVGFLRSIGGVVAGGDSAAGDARIGAIIEGLRSGQAFEDLVAGLLDDYEAALRARGGSSATYEALSGMSPSVLLSKDVLSAWGAEAAALMLSP